MEQDHLGGAHLAGGVRVGLRTRMLQYEYVGLFINLLVRHFHQKSWLLPPTAYSYATWGRRPRIGDQWPSRTAARRAKLS